MPATRIFVEGGSGQSTSRRTRFGSRIVVRVFDEMDNWMPGEEVRFTLPMALDVPSGRFPGGGFDFTEFTDAEGRAYSEFIDADDFLGTWRGTVWVVSNPLVRADFYLSNVVTPYTPSFIQITANADQTVAQYNAFQPVTARLTDELGNGVPFDNISMNCPAGSGTFPNGFPNIGVQTDAGGYATFPAFTASGALGTHEYTVGYPALFPAHGFFTIVDAGATTGLSPYAGNNQATPPNFLFQQPMVARVANGVNGPVAGVPVTFNLYDDNPAVAGLTWTSPFTDPVTQVSDINGLAISPSFSANAIAGTYLVAATAPGIPFVAWFQLTNGGEPPIPHMSTLMLCEV